MPKREVKQDWVCSVSDYEQTALQIKKIGLWFRAVVSEDFDSTLVWVWGSSRHRTLLMLSELEQGLM